MRMVIMTAAAAVMAATAMVSSASAGTIGCDPGEAQGTLNARSCRLWNAPAQASAQESFAMVQAPRAVTAQRGVYDTAPLDTSRHSTGISGGAGN